jgi:DNA modification methylase
MTRQLFYGDNLPILRERFADASVDLVYLDPPFNSKRDYNIIFKGRGAAHGGDPGAQVEAFKDTWVWGEQAEAEYHSLFHQPNTRVSEMMRSFREFLNETDLLAYLTMMATRLLELHRVLKPTGSLYLHCDPTASHYLKILLDAVFGVRQYRSEISWKRSSAHSDAKQGRAQYGNVRDVIFFYTKGPEWTWNWQYTDYDESYVRDFYRYVEEGTGRRYRLSDLTASRPGGDVSYEWKGVRPYKNRFWAYSRENMEAFEREGRLVYSKAGMPSYKRYLDEMPGVPLQNSWDDIRPASGNEFLGYPTQKPLALLERIIASSSNPGDVILDPFCGCGTAVHAAEKLGRSWAGIDITHLAVSLIEKRLRDAFPGLEFPVEGTPKDFAGARDLASRDKYQFQWWACSLVNAQPWQSGKKGADTGIDGLVYFQDDLKVPKKIIVSVKGGVSVGVTAVRELANVVEREKAAIGLLITLAKPTAAMQEAAVGAGYYESEATQRAFPRVQLLTIEGLLAGTEAARYPDLMRGGLNFKRAQVEVKPTTQTSLPLAAPASAETAAAPKSKRRRGDEV